MTTTRRQVALALVAVAAIALAACGGDDAGNPDSSLTPEEAQAPLEGAPPNLAEIRHQANELLDGGNDAFTERLAELEGTPVVVNKWASWCGPCRLEFPYFQAQADERGAEIAFLGIVTDDSEDAAATFLEELPLPYPSYLDPEKEIAQEIKSIAFPATAFYDRTGELVYTKQGQYEDEEALAADIDRYAR
jgi:cytochrome c biogenesis protein CcmG, thiol:disulfide interchange protein DsbE